MVKYAISMSYAKMCYGMVKSRFKFYTATLPTASEQKKGFLPPFGKKIFCSRKFITG